MASPSDKYAPLWNYVSSHCNNELVLTFDEIKDVLGFPIDHSFLNCKKELELLGFCVFHIYLKTRTIVFRPVKK